MINSHLLYDIVEGKKQVVEAPDIVIIEGLNVLQTGRAEQDQMFVSDFFDFSRSLRAPQLHEHGLRRIRAVSWRA